HQAGAIKQLYKADGQHAGQRRPGDEQRRVEVFDDEEGDDDAEQHGVADGVAHHRHAAEDEKGAGQGAGGSRHGRDKLDFNLVERHSSSPLAIRSASMRPAWVNVQWPGRLWRTRPRSASVSSVCPTPPLPALIVRKTAMSWACSGSSCCWASVYRSESTAVTRNRRRLRCRCSQRASRPRLGASNRLRKTRPLATSTMVGPVAKPPPLLLIKTPPTPETAPNRAARATITPRRLVHWRAAAAGATIIALISTTPTACRPTTIATTMRVMSSVSSARMGKPRLAPKLAS